MKRQSIVFLSIVFTLHIACAHAREIIHTTTIDTVLQHIENTTDLIVFDLDETLITLDHGEHWLAALLHQKKTDFNQIKGLYIWKAMQDEHRLIEPHTAQIISELQDKGYTVIALTARSTEEFVTHTALQLIKLGIDFTKSGSDFVDLTIDVLEHPALCHQGIISCGNNNKGAVLTHILEHLGLTPTKIIYMDDKLHHIQAVREHVILRNIPFIGIRYGRTDSTQALVSCEDHEHYHAWIQGETCTFID